MATVVAAGVVTSFAVPASAAVVTQVDEIRIEGGGFGFTDGADGAGTLTWLETGAGVVPSLHGELVLRGVATECARVRLITYEVGGFGEERFFSDEHCADDNDKQTFTVDLADDDYAIEAKITVQSKIDEDEWANVEPSRTVRYGPGLAPSEFLITRQEFDVGGGTELDGLEPAEPAVITWDVSDGWRIKPRAIGTLFAKNAENELARVRARCLDANGDLILEAGGLDSTAYSDEDGHFFDDNDEHAVEFDMQVCSDPAVVEVTVAIERFNQDPRVDDWEQVGFTRVPLPGLHLPPFEGPIDVDLDPLP